MFKKGYTPWNKGLKGVNTGPKNGNSGCFKKGHTPWSKGKKLSDKQKEKLVQYLKDNPRKKGTIPWNKGLKGSQVAWNKGIPMSDEHKRKLNLTRFGRKHTDETKKKIAEAKNFLGHKHSPETINIIKIKRALQVITEETRKKIGDGNRGKVLSEETIKKLSGENGSNWRGGITPKNKLDRTSAQCIKWRHLVLERDNYTCQISKIRGGHLHIHHIKNFSEYPDLRFEISNGITISKELHELFHNVYGRKNNTQEQLDEFINNYAVTNNTNISGGTEGIVG